MVKNFFNSCSLIAINFAVNDEAILSKTEAKLSDYDFLNHLKSKFLMTMFTNISSNPLFSDYSLKDRFVYIPQEKKQSFF